MLVIGAKLTVFPLTVVTADVGLTGVRFLQRISGLYDLHGEPFGAADHDLFSNAALGEIHVLADFDLLGAAVRELQGGFVFLDVDSGDCGDELGGFVHRYVGLVSGRGDSNGGVSLVLDLLAGLGHADDDFLGEGDDELVSNPDLIEV